MGEDPRAYNPLSIDPWEFRVMPHRQLLAMGQQSARLAFFDRLGVSASGLPALRTTGLRSRPDATIRCGFARQAAVVARASGGSASEAAAGASAVPGRNRPSGERSFMSGRADRADKPP